jgi:hypothetical protein
MTGPTPDGWQNLPSTLVASPLLNGAVATVVVLGVAGVVVARARLAAWRHRRLTEEARWVTIAAPPEVDAACAASLWLTLTGVLTPATAQRLLYGSAHVGWEYIWTGRTLTIRIWVPGTIPPGAVEAAVRAAWPGATVTTQPAGDPIPATVGGQAGGALWPQAADVLPLRTQHDADPLRALLAAGATVRHREHACLQILARPAPPRRVHAARQAARRGTDPANGLSAGGATGAATGLLNGAVGLLIEPLLWLTDVFLPGRPATSRPPRPGTAGTQRDALAEAHRRAVTEKVEAIPQSRSPSGTPSPPTPPDRPRRTRQRRRRTSRAGSSGTVWPGSRTLWRRPRRPTPAPTGYAGCG